MMVSRRRLFGVASLGVAAVVGAGAQSRSIQQSSGYVDWHPIDWQNAELLVDIDSPETVFLAPETRTRCVASLVAVTTTGSNHVKAQG